MLFTFLSIKTTMLLFFKKKTKHETKKIFITISVIYLAVQKGTGGKSD